MSLSAEDISCILILHANRFSFKGRISNPGTGKQAYTAGTTDSKLQASIG